MSELGKSMNGGYYVSKKQLLQWVNNTLHLNLTSIEHLGTGAVYCQLLDSLYPGRVPMHKVNWKAKFEYEITPNYKILQAALDHLGIEKRLGVEQLSKCKSSSNLELIQWLKRYIDLQGGPEPDYDPVQRRGKLKTGNQTLNPKMSALKNKQNYEEHDSETSVVIPQIKMSTTVRYSFKSSSASRSSRIQKTSPSQYCTKRTQYSVADVQYIEEEDELI